MPIDTDRPAPETAARGEGPTAGDADDDAAGDAVDNAAETAAATALERYRAVRRRTERLCAPLAVEDYVVQTMEDVSPTKWHLAHVSWFFETFLLQPHLPDYRPLDPTYAYLFNSYYIQAGERHSRDRRGYISRPTVAEVHDYRAYVDEHMTALLEGADGETRRAVGPLLEIGLNHEQQHQELLLTDIKHVFSVNPLRPAYAAPSEPVSTAPAAESASTAPAAESEGDAGNGGSERAGPTPLRWVEFSEGLREIGHEGDGFAYDNEAPRHRHFLDAFALADRLVTNGEFIEFIEDGGYERPELWLSAGWAHVQENDWSEPFYWEPGDGGRWSLYTLGGMRDVDPAEPVCHLSYFEADAFARWAGARLPTEQEWEVAAPGQPIGGNFVESERYHPAPADEADPADHETDPANAPLRQTYGDVWEWTRSQYSPYPGYAPPPGAIGEYNGKFMCNQFVLRGGSCATSRTHIRSTYRNFFPPDACWQFTGIRLARDA